MAGGNIRAGGAFVEIFGKDYLDKSLKAAGKNFEAFGKTVSAVGASIAAAGTAALAPLIAATKTFADVGDEAQKAALRTGATTNAISELGYAAGQSGSSLADVEVGLKNMQRNLFDAARGGKEASETLDALGLTVAYLQGLTPDQQFESIADRLASIEDPARRAALAMRLFGRSGTTLLPLLSEGAAGIRALRDEAIELGASIDQADADAAAALGDAWSRAKTSFTGAAVQVGAALAPALEQMADAITRTIVSVKSWIADNRDAVLTVAAVAAGAIAAGTAITALGVAITGVGVALSSAVALVGTMTAAVTALVNPFNLLIAAAGAAGVALVGFGLQGTNAFGTMKSALQGVIDALMAGDLESAWEVVLAAVELVFERFTQRLLVAWDAFAEEFRKRAESLDPFSFRLTRTAPNPELETRNQRRDDAVKAAELRLFQAQLDAADKRGEAALQSFLENLDRTAEATRRAEDAMAALADAVPEDLGDIGSGTMLGGPGGLIASGFGLALQQGLDRVVSAVEKVRVTSEGTFSGQAAALLGFRQDIDRQQLETQLELVRETREVRKATERNAAVFI